ncbi:alpha-protein kinase 3 [Leucoraja erinacea]|uniref:alpha-protein kinase 3 n=1 Tax=Leucoraja erinaceus TaxID=7782 RepID=UPI002456EECB|nr:alpha-protein kinase 3 [Leucoraja erinacea]
MSSKRTIRSYSANGHCPSFDTNGENEPPVRGESSRSYFLNVRPENRQTFCTIIAQITEETQPGFETTLKSHSVSEDSDIKFHCIVSGHPAPEITWYKDDKEMDRYCGLPKYQIFQYGKKHSLQLYKCTEDDAAIYQASARNSKGIVSCSGVLEVGTMNEYKIHQRWFGRLKQKADAKRRELEESRMRGKENIASMANIHDRNLQRTLSPERAQRKRKSQLEAKAVSLDSWRDKEDGFKVHVPDPHATLSKSVERAEKDTVSRGEIHNGYITGAQGAELAAMTEGKLPANNSLDDLEQRLLFGSGIYEVEPLVSPRPSDKEFAARKKKRRISGDQGRAPSKKAEGDETALNGLDQGSGSGDLSRYLRDTLRRSKLRRDPQRSQSEDYMGIDEQVASVVLGQRQRPPSPKSERTEIQSDFGRQSHEEAQSEATTFTNGAKPDDQEPTFSSPQSPDKDAYFSMRDMYLETISGPESLSQRQLTQALEKIFEVDAQPQPDGQKVAPSGFADDVPGQMEARSGNDGEPMKTSEGLQKMEVSRTEVDAWTPQARSQMLKVDGFNKVQPSCGVTEDAGGNKPREGGICTVDMPGNSAQEGFKSPVSPVNTVPQPVFRVSYSSVAVQTEDILEDLTPCGQGYLPKYPPLALPNEQLEYPTLPEAMGLRQGTEPNGSPVSEKVDSEGSVGAFSDEWEKLDIPSGSEQTDILGEPPVPVTSASGETEEELRDCHSEGTSPPQSDEEVSPVAGRIDQTAHQQDLTTDIKAMEISTTPLAVVSQIVAIPQISREETILADEEPLVVEEIPGQQVVTGSQPDAPSTGSEVPLDEEVSSEVSVENEKVSEEIEDEPLNVNEEEEARPREEEPAPASADGFGTHLVEKFLSYLKLPSFLSGEKSVPGVGKPEAAADNLPVPDLHSDKGVPHKTKEHTDASELPATAVEISLESDVSPTSANVLPASTEDHHLPEEDRPLDAPLVEVDVDPVELVIRSLLTTVEELNVDTAIIVPPSSTLSAPLSNVASWTALGDDSAPDVVDTGDPETPLQPTAAPETPFDQYTQPSQVEALRLPRLEMVSSPPPSLDVKSLEGPEEEQGRVGESKMDLTAHKSLVDKAEEPNSAGEISGDQSKMLQVTLVPSDGTVPAPGPSTEDVDVSQPTKMTSDVRVEVSQVPSIVVDNVALKSVTQERVEDTEALKKEVPPAQGSNAKMKLSDAVPTIPSATPAELASGARRKIFLPRSKQVEESEALAADLPALSAHTKKEEGVRKVLAEGDAGHAEEEPARFPLALKRSAALLQAPAVQQNAPLERRSPTTARKMSTLEVPKLYEEPADKIESSVDPGKSGAKTDEAKSAKNLLKAPQVIRKIRAEQFSDASGNLKLWCQFFNVLSDSTIRWDKDGLHLNKLKRSAGDESQVSLAIVKASAKDCGVYRCMVENEYGSDATDLLLSSEMLTGFVSREEIEVGEEVEMTPMPITKGLTDTGFWGNKLFGRIMTTELNVGDGFRRKASRVKVIYGLEPIFESGATCIVKVRNYISYGTKPVGGLVDSNHDLTMQECKLQNTAREYSKIFAAETRAVEGFGPVPEIIPLHLLYRPGNNIPYATIERDLMGQFVKYAMEDKSKNLVGENGSEVVQKCHTFQHWIYQWTNCNLLVTDLQGVGMKITSVQIATNSKGYQDLTGNCSSSAIEEFPDTHQCNHLCEALLLKSLKNGDSLHRPKGSKSPSMTRRAQSAQSSPQMQRKGQSSPQSQRKGQASPQSQRKGQVSPLVQRKGQTSPLVPRKGLLSPQASRKNISDPTVAPKDGSAEDSQETVKHKTVEISKTVKLR